MAGDFSHIGKDGRARMVDVGGKAATRRMAVARATVVMNPETYSLLAARALPKGDALGAARLAGIMAAKKAAELIPLCHPLPLTHADVDFSFDAPAATVVVTARAATEAATGVEMEAMTAAAVAALTLYDMCKAVQKDIVIGEVRLLFKSGGKSGPFQAAGYTPGPDDEVA
ncbi:MAG: cyclic pyranopterin monophosphate synthase MoaC [Desulfovibrionaceae bacterium]|nr:cyclic pyranopterin monophosphate synthase MoaC [Desulfovibrionaceae bacterium]MBF0514039.1 cyclic pyranopterin monophosphate synthase MoaC [Desulfovibrionaceae bacterium]